MATQIPDFKFIFKRLLPKCGPLRLTTLGGLQCPQYPQLEKLCHTPGLTTLLEIRSRATGSCLSQLQCVYIFKVSIDAILFYYSAPEV